MSPHYKGFAGNCKAAILILAINAKTVAEE
jgi:hypothetical protein